MINPNKKQSVTGTIIAAESYTSMIVFKVDTEHGIFDYTVFGNNNDDLSIGDEINAILAYSITMNGYFISAIKTLNKAA